MCRGAAPRADTLRSDTGGRIRTYAGIGLVTSLTLAVACLGTPVLAGAARAGAMRRRAMIVELQRDADDVIAFALQEAGNDGGIDAARHGDDDAGVFRASWKVEAVHGSFVLRGA